MKDILFKLRQFYITYERHLTTGAFVVGFAVDSLTLTRIDLLYDNVILFSYLMVAALTILFIGAVQRGMFQAAFFAPARSFAPLVMQFSFGGLFSGFFIFYTQSATLAASWPFLVLLLALLIGNEFFKKSYTRLVFQVSMFFFVLFSFMIFYVPIIVETIGTWVFLLSGAVSLGIIAVFIQVLERLQGEVFKQSKRALTISIGAIFLVVNGLYFTNTIPPIPLSLKSAGVYHSVSRADDGYMLRQEPGPWYAFLEPRDTIRRVPSEPVYVFSSVFAPTDLQTTIIHEWQMHNETRGEWETADRFAFSILGGRDGGYRGYTRKSNVSAGLWRVNIKTQSGQLIGREVFEVISVDEVPELETILR